jgi:hypothetical protein
VPTFNHFYHRFPWGTPKNFSFLVDMRIMPQNAKWGNHFCIPIAHKKSATRGRMVELKNGLRTIVLIGRPPKA